jgi:hypothetical protein
METSSKRLAAIFALVILTGLVMLSSCGGDNTPSPAQAPTVASALASATVQSQAHTLPSETPAALSQSLDATPEATSVIAPPEPPAGEGTVGVPRPNSTPTVAPVGLIVADSGFRPKPDGYSFENYVGKKRNGKIVPELAVSDLLKMFGESEVCIKLQNGVCTPRQEALAWLNQMNAEFLGGHCEGMAVSSLVLWKGLDTASNYGDGANTTFDLKLNAPVKSLIAYYFTLQMVDPVMTEYAKAEEVAPSVVLDQVIASMQNESPDPVNLGFYGVTSDGDIAGHSITPYAVEDMGNGIFRIRVYDNNWPNKDDAYMEIDRNKETWTYDLSAKNPEIPPEVWSGDDVSQTLAALPISVRTGTLVCPWCETPTEGSNNNVIGSIVKSPAANLDLASYAPVGELNTNTSGSTNMQVIMNGDGHLLIQNSKGQRLGFDGKKIVNEIPGARFTVPRGGAGVKVEPVYYLPKGEAYSIKIDGETVKAGTNGSSTVSIFGHDMSATLDNIALNKGDKHQLDISADGRNLSFVSGNSSTAPTFQLAATLAKGAGTTANSPTSYLFEVGDAAMSKGQQLSFSLDKPAGQVTIKSGGTANPIKYNLQITRSDTSGTKSFQKANVTLGTNDTHQLNFSNWDSSLDVQVDVDQGSNGSVDSTQTVPTAVPTTEP